MDDDPDFCQSLSLLLGLRGYSACAAHDGTSGLQHLRQHPPPCLIVLDLRMPLMGGREFLIEKLWRDAKLTEIGEGASEIQRLVISKALLK